jgi:glycosyltransferase involved in cell wall biosynthesis
VLTLTRWMFNKTVFHFHLAGISELYVRLPGWQRWLFRRAYFGADASIRLSEFNPEDGRRLEAKRHFVVANGIDDPCPELTGVRTPAAITAENPLKILFVAILYESKGLMVLVDACGKLAERGVPFVLEVMGNWQSEEYAARVHKRIDELDIGDRVRFLGRVIGDEKFAPYRNADVFCFPTFFHCEALPVVLLEATACGLPVVATRWRGIPSIVDDGETGFLVEPHDADAVAERLTQLADSPELRERMGAAGRKKFTREYTVSRHLEAMRSVFLEVGESEHEVVREASQALAAT